MMLYVVHCSECGYHRRPQSILSAKITRKVHAKAHRHAAVILPAPDGSVVPELSWVVTRHNADRMFFGADEQIVRAKSA